MRRSPSRSAIEQRIVCGELSCFFFQHYRHGVAYRVSEPVQPADEYLGVALEKQRALAHRAGEDLEQARIHHTRPPASPVGRTFANTRERSSSASAAGSSARTGTYQSRASANVVHFTASFSVMRTGSSSATGRSAAVS